MINEEQVKNIIHGCENYLSTLLQKPVKLELKIVSGHIEKELIKLLVTQAYNAEWMQIISKKRHRGIVIVRMIYCYLMRRYTALSFAAIGTEINRDHSTVINSVRTIEGYMSVCDKSVAGIYTLIDELDELEKKKNEEN